MNRRKMGLAPTLVGVLQGRCMGVTSELDEIPLSTTIIIVNTMKNKGKRIYLIYLQIIVRNCTALAFRKIR